MSLLRTRMVAGWVIRAWLFAMITAKADAANGKLARAEELYWTTQYGPALALLDKSSTDARELDLLGRIHYAQGDYQLATDYLTKAVEADPKSSKYRDWLGRAWGMLAATSGPLSAAGYAVKARGYFEQAIQLDPKNKDALNDVFDFYLEAPRIMGGGLDKAQRVAEEIAELDPADGYATKARIAEKKKDAASAEQAYRRAIETAPEQVGHQLALARFLANQGRYAESDAAFQKAQHDFPNVPRVSYAYAEALIRQKRNLNDARQLLEKYMQAPLTADDPSRRDANKLLEKASAGG